MLCWKIAIDYGKGYFGLRVVEKGQYGRCVKWTVILAVAATGERWCLIEQKSGTTTLDFVHFIEHVVGSINQEAYGGARTILMDNLSAHRSLIVQQTVMATGQQLLYRRKYSPADAPIEYVFNTCQSELHIRMREINLLNIVYLIIDIISNMNGFANYFVFYGY